MNTLKTFALLMFLSGVLVVAGAVIAGPIGVVFALVIALVMNVGSYWFSDRLALKMTGSVPVTEDEAPDLYRLVLEQATLADLPMPKVYVIATESPNAFATGRSPNHAAIAVTTGLCRLLNRDEIAAVVAHELAHVHNRDTLIMSVVAVLAGAISALALFAHFVTFFGGRDRGGSVVVLLAVAIITPFVAMLVRSAISRSREFQADATGARHSGEPMVLANALQKIEDYSCAGPAMKVNRSVSHLFISNPFRGSFLSSVFSSHPSTRDRVNRLTELAGEVDSSGFTGGGEFDPLVFDPGPVSGPAVVSDPGTVSDPGAVSDPSTEADPDRIWPGKF